MTNKVLVIEDQLEMANLVKLHLSDIDCSVKLAFDGLTGLADAEANKYDLIILDLMLPGENGLEICRRLRARADYTPILMLTSRASELERVLGLEMGADDYLTKPFAFAELVARVRALGRRASPPAPPLLTAEDVALDPARRTVERAGRPVELTRKEFGVLEVLLGAGGAVVSSEELLERVWDENADPFTTTVRVTVMTLRKKLGDPGVIETVVGAGYRVPAAG